MQHRYLPKGIRSSSRDRPIPENSFPLCLEQDDTRLARNEDNPVGYRESSSSSNRQVRFPDNPKSSPGDPTISHRRGCSRISFPDRDGSRPPHRSRLARFGSSLRSDRGSCEAIVVRTHFRMQPRRRDGFEECRVERAYRDAFLEKNKVWKGETKVNTLHWKDFPEPFLLSIIIGRNTRSPLFLVLSSLFSGPAYMKDYHFLPCPSISACNTASITVSKPAPPPASGNENTRVRVSAISAAPNGWFSRRVESSFRANCGFRKM